MRVWIAEKPDVARKIAKALGDASNGNGFITCGRGDIVTWCIGFMLESFAPEDYDPAYKRWALDLLPILPDKLQKKPAEGKQGQLSTIINLLKKKASSVVIATDAGRAGEAIAWEVLTRAEWDGPVSRLWASAMNDSYLKKACQNLIDDTPKKPLYIAERLRQSMDWADGMNWSRFYTIRVGRSATQDRVPPLSIGRVQTATLAIIVDRDSHIETFKKTPYYDLEATVPVETGTLKLFHRPDEAKRIVDRHVAVDLAARAAADRSTLKVTTTPKNFAPPNPYNLAQLSAAASAKRGWSAKKTLEVAQSLYEKGITTYPRVDEVCLAESLAGELGPYLAHLRRLPWCQGHVPDQPVIRKAVFDDKKIPEHHAIIVTDTPGDVSALSPDEIFIYELVSKRFCAALMPDAEGATTTISTVLGGVTFKTSGTVYNKLGWKAVWGDEDDAPENKKEDEEPEPRLPRVRDGEAANPSGVRVLDKETKPKPRYTEGSIITAMIKAGSEHDDDEVRDTLAEIGIGTKATRAEVIETLKKRMYVTVDGKKIISTQRGRDLIRVLRSEGNRLADVKSTAELEKQMRRVESEPRLALDLWQHHVTHIRNEIARLKKLPTPPPVAAPPAGGGSAMPRSGSYARRPAAGGAKKPYKKSASPSRAQTR